MPLTRARILRFDDVTVECNPFEAQPRSKQILRREVLQAKAEAEQILREAQATAKQQLEAAERQASDTRETAKQAGYEEGLAQAAAEACALIEKQQSDNAQSTERIVGLARLLAERLVGRSLMIDETTATSMAQTLLTEVRGARHVVLAAHPDDLAAIEATVSKLNLVADFRLQANPDLARGDFALTTDLGSLEGSLGSRIGVLAKKLEQGLKA